MGDDGESEALLKWLEDSGRALELRVLRAFRKHAHARHSVRYVDRSSQKTREVDVLARLRGRYGAADQPFLDVVVECKTGKPGSQWVAFRDESSPSRFPPDQDAWLTACEPGAKSSFANAWDWRPPFTDRINVSSLVTAHDGKDTAYDAVQQLSSAVAGHVDFVRAHDEKPVKTFDESTGESAYWSALQAGVLGIVITSVPIYVADLDEADSPTVAPVEIVAVPSKGIINKGRHGSSWRTSQHSIGWSAIYPRLSTNSESEDLVAELPAAARTDERIPTAPNSSLTTLSAGPAAAH